MDVVCYIQEGKKILKNGVEFKLLPLSETDLRHVSQDSDR
jgi:hypothetical protein